MAILMPYVLLSLAVLRFLFWVWMLIDCATRESGQGNTKIVWILIIVLTQLIGAAIYFFVRRPQRYAELRR